MKLDILVFSAHPDDAELACAGTIARYARQGKKVGVIDLTRGEMGTRGTEELRKKEALDSAEILGLAIRENLELADAFFVNDREHQLKLVRQIRRYRPEIVLANAPEDRHPDHGRAGKLALDSCFISGLRKVETELNGVAQEAWRPRLFLHYLQDKLLKPDILIDISETIDVKIASIKAFKSQFHNKEYTSQEPQTYISTPQFLDVITGRSAEFGKLIGTAHAEAYISPKWLGVDDLFHLK